MSLHRGPAVLWNWRQVNTYCQEGEQTRTLELAHYLDARWDTGIKLQISVEKKVCLT